MTGVTTWNKGKAPAGGDGWSLTPDVRLAVESLNVPVPVADAAERDGITPPLGKYPGMMVVRTDVAGFPIEVWDGAAWIRQPVVTAGAVVPDGLWTITGGYLKTVVNGLTQVTATLQMVRTGSNMTINVADTTLTSAIVPAGFRPSANAMFAATVNNQFGEYNSTPQLIINTGGALVGRSTSGSAVAVNTGYSIFISASWYI